MRILKPANVFIFIFSFIFILACGGTAVPAANNEPKMVLHMEDSSEVVEITTENVRQPNCDGTAEVENQIEKSRSIQHIIETSGEFSVNGSGQIGFMGTDVDLGAAVALQLGTSYGLTETFTRSLTVKARPGANMVHTIRQTEIWKVGTAEISVGADQVIVPFRFRDDFAIELISSKDEGCPASSADAAGSGTQPTAVVVPTFTPQATNTVAPNGVNGVLVSDPINVSRTSTNYEGKVLLTVEKIDVLANNRMRWYISFWNQGDRDAGMEFGWDAPYSYVADEFGTKYSILSMEPSKFIASGVQAGTKLSGWLEFDSPTNGAKSFKLFMIRWSYGTQQLRYDDPLEIFLQEPLVP